MPPDAASRRPILVIDDSPLQNLLLQRQLVSLGQPAVLLDDPLRAVQTARDCRAGLALIEVLMLETNGFAVGRQLMESLALPCVLMSATARRTDWRWARKLGFARILYRPVTLQSLCRILEIPAREDSDESLAAQ